jgi:hypothetical protein
VNLLACGGRRLRRVGIRDYWVQCDNGLVDCPQVLDRLVIISPCLLNGQQWGVPWQLAVDYYPCVLQPLWVGLNSEACFPWHWILPLSDRECPRFEIYHYRHMVVSQARRPFFSPDIKKLLQQTDGLCQVPLFLAIKLPFVFCRHGHCHDEGIWSSHCKACRPSLSEGDLLVSPFPAEELGILVNTGIPESPCAFLIGMSGVSRTVGEFGCQWL